MLRVTRVSGVIEIATGSTCNNAMGVWDVHFDDGVIRAFAGQVVHGTPLNWTARTVTSEQLLLAPAFAPTWEWFKLVAPGQIEWSSAPASGSEKPSGFVLARVEERP